MVNDVYYFFANMRSGHHAVINWIISCLKGKIFQVRNPFYESFLEGKIEKKDNPCNNLWRKFEGHKKDKNFIFEFENLSIKQIKALPLLGNAKKIFIVRDIYNNLASQIKYYKNKGVNLIHSDGTNRPETIKQNFIEYLERGENIILYNNWFKSEKYCKNICKGYGWSYKKKTGLVSKNGMGSSFDDLRGNANQFKVLERYKIMLNDSDFQREIKGNYSQLMGDYNHKYFGWRL